MSLDLGKVKVDQLVSFIPIIRTDGRISSKDCHDDGVLVQDWLVVGVETIDTRIAPEFGRNPTKCYWKERAAKKSINHILAVCKVLINMFEHSGSFVIEM